MKRNVRARYDQKVVTRVTRGLKLRLERLAVKREQPLSEMTREALKTFAAEKEGQS